MARELFAPVGGRALGLRSEGSWLAAELLRAGLEPGAHQLSCKPAIL